jgi:murein DD-endopeptidase MepM/ murein hydrolase activator NlpD
VLTRSSAARGATLVVVAGACAATAVLPPARASTPSGGAEFVARPVISKVTCIRRCASRRRARPGSTLRISGAELRRVNRVTFHGSYGRSDNLIVRVRSGSYRRVHVRVPAGAVTGPLSVRVSRRLRSKLSRRVAILPTAPPEPNPTLTPVPGPREAGAPRIETGTNKTKVFYAARRAVTFSYRIQDREAVAVQVELVRAADGTVVKTWSPPPARPGEVSSIVWSGKARSGRYSFRLTARGPNGASARSAGPQDAGRDAFDLYSHYFPIRGRHDYGGSGARFGAGRSGHSHQGQDVFASCGTKLVAARGGRVQYSGYHGSAGYYIVVDGTGTSVDYVYMHLAEPSPFRKGDRVFTGTRIGSVGETGNARGCHLHFELWRGGWYEGGSPYDPLSSLRAWDSWS